ncbi:MAG: hypothetical protein L6R40_004153 [Gallowayella cf. fulva]|nr:MAG: hypothetical protein L6R40_004153 [Xanthomendoza cf. fulva]
MTSKWRIPFLATTKLLILGATQGRLGRISCEGCGMMTVRPNPRGEHGINSREEAENEQTDALVVDADHQVHGETTIESSQRQGEQGLAAPAAASGGRRRGRRKVMKKKMLKDDEGYLEEPAWESFSEDEPAPKESTPASTVSSVTKGKKATGKPGQGNIMSFFGKR